MSGPRWFDSHCHIQDAYRPEGAQLSELLSAATEAGVEGLVCVGTDASSSLQALALVEEIRAGRSGTASLQAWATIGLHPHEASQGTDSVSTLLAEAVGGGKAVVAVGECGLDYHYDHSPRPAQRQAFAEQIDLARRHGLALVVHTREAWDDTLALLAGADGERVVVHCFTGGPEEARRCLDLGACLSFSGIVTFANAQDVRDAAAMCPMDRLLVETDAPFLAPVPHRGRPNEPAFVGLVGAAVAEVKGVAVEVLAESTISVARRMFALP